jgi:hypothetical protein
VPGKSGSIFRRGLKIPAEHAEKDHDAARRQTTGQETAPHGNDTDGGTMNTIRRWVLYTVILIGALCAVPALADQAPCDCPDGSTGTTREEGSSPYAPPEPSLGDRTTGDAGPSAYAPSSAAASPMIPPAPQARLETDEPAQRTPIIPPGYAAGSPAIVMIRLVDR